MIYLSFFSNKYGLQYPNLKSDLSCLLACFFMIPTRSGEVFRRCYAFLYLGTVAHTRYPWSVCVTKLRDREGGVNRNLLEDMNYLAGRKCMS